MISFQKITYENVDDIVALSVRDDQKTFVASNSGSLIDAYVAISMGATALPFGIYDDETLVGFIMFGYGRLDEDDPEICDDNYCLWRFMIDQRYQAKGLGKQALAEALAYLKTAPVGVGKGCWLSYEPENTVARDLYRQFGFVENGEMCDDEVVAYLPFPETTVNTTSSNFLSLPANVLRNLFKNVYFFNGTAYAGKSTMVHVLAEKYDAIECGENYHDCLQHLVDKEHQPNLSYFETMKDWQEFVNRKPEVYKAWIDGTSKEAAQLEIMKLIQLATQYPNKKIFVDTNISPEILHQISDYHHVVIMLSPQSMSVDRFFDRSDPDKQFLLNQIDMAEDPAATMANFRACLALINSPENYHYFENCGFFTLVRTEESVLEERVAIVEKHFGFIK